jgi:hypothetical protein
MVHPLYLFYPFMDNAPGFMSQCLYLAYISSVLTTESRIEEQTGDYDDEGYVFSDVDDDWDKSACLMEMDRLSRILNAKFDTPPFVDTVRNDVAEYINRPSQIRGDVKLGLAHYKIILTETKNSLHRILEADPKKPHVWESFIFIIGEMERMDYITPEDAKTMKDSFAIPEDKTVHH